MEYNLQKAQQITNVHFHFYGITLEPDLQLRKIEKYIQEKH